ncbi:uncharacterized protein LOC122367691 [Amphibalanus amphitrite]|uniref:uncharacterized protein LOC122367691 n=1 Tax=Amphibalanus amphitrite TaxID=1232801 RepID=UPI001C90D1FB|nr:uncharacterized protein LOC122367691 [Amphibalanus amphitrite]
MASVFGVCSYFQDDNKLIRRGELALKASHLLTFDYDPDIGSCRAKVQASMKKKAYTVEITVDKEGNILETLCECPRGQSKCHHMATVALFSSQNSSSTSKPCTWSQPKTAKEPASSVPADAFLPLGSIAEMDIAWMKEELQRLEPCHLSWISKPCEDQDPHIRYLDVSECCATVGYNSLGAEEIAVIERATKGQRTNPNWSRARKGRLTASNFGAVLKVRGRKPSASLLKTLTAGNFLGRVAAIQWGVTHEKDAIELFEKHFDVKVDQSGIWLHESGVLGASPDGMIGASEIIEVKCPFSARGGLFKKIDEGSFYIKRSTEAVDENQEYYLDATCDPGSAYYHQVQGNLCLTGRDVCHLVVWAPGEMVVVTVRKDPAWAQNLDTLIAFFDEHMRPDRTVTRANSPLLLCVLREGEPSEE